MGSTSAHGINTSRQESGLRIATRPVGREAIAPEGSPYIPSLDGIRAISFLLVFFSHASLGGGLIPGGFGVTTFFLLSGFLITTLLRLEFDRYGRISLRGFYLRRVLRILPPLYITLLLAVALFLEGPGRSAFPTAGTIAQALQVSNYYQIYAHPAVTIPGTGVLWSLGVEEHFYLLFPILYVAMRPRLSESRQAALLLTLCAGALAWRCILQFHFHAPVARTFYGTDTRFDSILFGCTFAVIANPLLRDPPADWIRTRLNWLLPVCALVLLVTFLERDDRFRETLRYTLQGLALIPLFIAAIHYHKAMPGVILNMPVLRYIGVLSYSLYLCHSVIIEFLRREWPQGPVLTGAASLACALGFAVAVHYAVERPCTRLRRRLSRTLLSP